MYSFISESKTSRFAGALKEGRIEATRCIKCDRTFFPPRADCPYCYDSNTQWFDIKSREGTLKTFTTVEVAPTEFISHKPYCVAIIDLPEGISIMGWIKGSEEELQVGDRMKVVIENTSDSNMIYFQK